MTNRISRIALSATALLALLLFSSISANAQQDAFDVYLKSQSEIPKLKARIMTECSITDSLELWNKLWIDTPDCSTTSKALRLMNALFPKGDLSKWNEISGFITGSDKKRIPKSLAALEASQVAIVSLMKIKSEPYAPWLARDIFLSVTEFPEIKRIGMRADSERFSYMLEKFRSMRQFNDIVNSGQLPWKPLKKDMLILGTSRLLKSDISSVMAQQRRRIAIYLTSKGKVSSNESGFFRWDWERGEVYRVPPDECG